MVKSRSWRSRMAAGGILILATAVFAVAKDTPAYGDATAPPPFANLNCPGPTNPAPNAAPNAPFTPYQVPFKGIIFDGQITLPPNVKIPHIYASVCGLVQIPQLTGTITGSDIEVAVPNIYVAGLEAIPLVDGHGKPSLSFGALHAGIDMTPAHNGGLDITLTGTTLASVTTLGMTCGITLNATFTTKTDGALEGQPVTGPTEQGQAEVVSNSFAVPAIQGSDSGLCPPSIAQTFNKLLGLPAAAGVGSFTAPFCFDFELEKVSLPPKTASCPWPSS